MGYGLKYDSLGTPTVEVLGALPDVYPAGAAWMVLGGGGGMFLPEYEGAFGMASGAPAIGLRWGATIMTAAPTEQQQEVAGWAVSAALFQADGTAVQPLACSVLDAKTWAIEMPTLPAGPKRVMIVSVTSRKPGATTTLRTPVLLLVAGA
jgi:hypothetical protein